jgi:hypothetical protein
MKKRQCGWCGEMVDWKEQSAAHSYGTCVSGPDVAHRRRLWVKYHPYAAYPEWFKEGKRA